MREAAVQSWPEFQYPAILIPSATAAGSASSKTSTGALPPSSRCTRLSVSAAVRAISLPVFTSPVSETRRTSGCRTIPAPTGSPSPVITLKTPGGRISAASSAKRSVASGERGRQLPDRHHQRVVPRGDPADYPERLAPDHRGVAAHVLARRLALEHTCRAREETDVVGRHGHLVPG